MRSSFLADAKVWFTALIAIVFGLCLNILLPLFAQKTLFLIFLPVSLVFFILLVTKPRFTLVLILLARPILDNALNMTKVDMSGQNVGVGAILNLVVILLSVFFIFYQGDFPKEVKTIRAWIIYLVLMFMAALYSPFKGEGIRLFLNFVSYFSMFILPLLLIKTKEDFIFFLKVYAWSFVLPVCFANLDLLHGGQFYADAGMRIRGTFSHPNVLAFYLVLGFVFFFYLLKSKYIALNNKFGIFVKLLMFNMLVLLIATKTRNAWVAFALFFFIYGFLKERRILVIMALMIPILLLIPQVKERVITVVDSSAGSLDYKGVNSFEWRVQMWKSSLSKIASRPIFGYGLTSFKPMSESFSNDRVAMGAHNAYLEMLFETGIVGLIAYLALFISPLILFYKKMKATLNLQVAQLWAIVIGYIVSYMAICFADNLSYYLAFNWYVWFFLGMMMVVSHKEITSNV